MECFLAFSSSLRSSSFSFVVFGIQCVSQLSKRLSSEISYALEIVSGSFLLRYQGFFVKFTNLSLSRYLQKISGFTAKGQFQLFTGRRDALKAPSLSFAVLHFKLAVLCTQKCSLFLSAIVNQSWMLIDWLANFWVFFQDNDSCSRIKYLTHDFKICFKYCWWASLQFQLWPQQRARRFCCWLQSEAVTIFCAFFQ